MDIVKLIILFVFSASAYSAASPTISWVDGPASGIYERTANTMRIYTDFPPLGSHAVQTFDTSPAVAGSGGSYVGPASTATTPKIASKVAIPLAAGATLTATLTGIIPKAKLAAAAAALIKANPYISTVLTLAWLAQAGVSYFSDTGEFKTNATTTTSTCVFNTSSSPGSIYYNATSKVLNIIQAYPSSSCPSNGYNWTGWCKQNYACASGQCSTCNYTGVQTNPLLPATQEQAAQRLSSSPISSSGDSAPGYDGLIKEQMAGGHLPDLSGDPNQLTGLPDPIHGKKTVKTLPDGTVVTEAVTYNPTFQDNHVDIGEITTVTTTYPDNTTTTTTTISNDIPDTTSQTESQQTDCDKFPESIGCSEYGTVPPPDTITETNVSIGLTPSSWGSGSCPAPMVLSLKSTSSKEFSYQPVCDFMTGVYPVVIAIAWFLAGFIVLGSVKD